LSKIQLSIGCSGLKSPFADECMIALILKEGDLIKNFEEFPIGLQNFLNSPEYIDVLNEWEIHSEKIWF
jgi:hypothetical protein